MRLVTKACGTVLFGAAFSLLLAPAAGAQVSTPDVDSVTVSSDPATVVPPAATDPVREIVKPAVEKVTSAVSAPVDAIEEGVADLTAEAPASDGSASPARPRSVVDQDGPSRTPATRARANTGGRPAQAGVDGLVGLVSSELRDVTSAPATSALRPTLLERIAQGALEAGERFAFPLALALMAGAFLVLQGRIGRNDPKLALAPVDGENFLRFQ